MKEATYGKSVLGEERCGFSGLYGEADNLSLSHSLLAVYMANSWNKSLLQVLPAFRQVFKQWVGKENEKHPTHMQGKQGLLEPSLSPLHLPACWSWQYLVPVLDCFCSLASETLHIFDWLEQKPPGPFQYTDSITCSIPSASMIPSAS